MIRPASVAAFALAFASFATVIPSAHAITEAQIIDMAAPILGLDPDQVTAFKFYLKNGPCMEKVIQYTVAEDYSLDALIAALKISKNGVADVPKITQAQCKAANPVDNLWRILATEPANKLLGTNNAQLLKTLLKEQKDKGQKYVNDQITAIPYIGTILGNWNCGCDFAFETDFKAEKVAAQASRDVVQVAKYAKAKNYDAMIEFVIEKWGPAVGCKLGEDFVGTTSIPIVSGLIHKACVGVAGTVAGWVSGSVTAHLQFVGLLDSKKGIPPETWYEYNMALPARNPNYAALLPGLQTACVEYYKPTDMADDTARKACQVLANRFMVEGESNAQWRARSDERSAGWQQANMGPVATETAMSTDAEFLVRASQAQSSCEAYFLGKYPKAPPDKWCANVAVKNLHAGREGVQKAALDKAREAGKPFCSSGERNALVCTGATYAACRKVLPANCTPSTMKDGKAFPCCVVGAADKTTQSHVEGDKKFAASAGDYCRTRPQDPFAVECATKEARDLLYQLAAKTGSYPPDCAQVSKNPAGLHEKTCLTVVPAMLDEIQGVKELPGIIDSINTELGYPACLATSKVSAGKLRADDRRVAHCSPVGVQACRKKLPLECKKGPMDLVEKACCDTDAFIPDKQAYDPKKRSAAELALVKKAQAKLAPGCRFATTAGLPPDEFHLVCDNANQRAQCQAELVDVNRAKSACETAGSRKTYLSSAYDSMVVTPCCSVKMDFDKTQAPPAVVSPPPATTSPPKGLGPGSVAQPPGGTTSTPAKPPSGTTSAFPSQPGSYGIGKPPAGPANPGPTFGAGTSNLAPQSGPLKPLIDAGCKAVPGDPLTFRCPAGAIEACHRLEREKKVKGCVR